MNGVPPGHFCPYAQVEASCCNHRASHPPLLQDREEEPEKAVGADFLIALLPWSTKEEARAHMAAQTLPAPPISKPPSPPSQGTH